MFHYIARSSLLLLASSAIAQDLAHHKPSEPLKDALIGKIAYAAGEQDAAAKALFRLATTTALDEKTYLQLFELALKQGQEQELLELSQQYDSGESDPVYQKGVAVLQLYLGQNLNSREWDYLSKNDWVTFFSRIPAQQRLAFLDQVYQPAMLESASAKAFMIEMLQLIGLTQEALDLAQHPIQRPNQDLLRTYAQHFPAGVSSKLIASLSITNDTDFSYQWARYVLELHADQPLAADLPKILSNNDWDQQQRFNIACYAISHGHSPILWSVWSFSDFSEQQRLVLHMTQLCYDEDWITLEAMLQQYPQQDDHYLYYQGHVYGHRDDIQRAVWSFERIVDPQLRIQAQAHQAHLVVSHNPTAAMLLAKQLLQEQVWGQRELGVLQAQIMHQLGYTQEAVAFLEKLVEEEKGYAPAIHLLAQYYLKTEQGLPKAQSLLKRYKINQGKSVRLLKKHGL